MAARTYVTIHAAYKKKYNHSYYRKHRESILAWQKLYRQLLACAKARSMKKTKRVLKRARKCYAKHTQRLCANRRRRYYLAEPNLVVKQQYVSRLFQNFLLAPQEVVCSFRNEHADIVKSMSAATCKRTACSIVAKGLVNQALALRKQYAGVLLKSIRGINNMKISKRADFGDGLHSIRSEPYFYDAAYTYPDRPSVMCIDTHGRYRPIEKNDTSNDIPRVWECTNKCKPISALEADMILNLKAEFEKPVEEVRKVLDKCDECPNKHYTKIHDSVSTPLKGHSHLCYTGEECQSKLRILRAASTHYSVLRSFLLAVYSTLYSHKSIANIDQALHTGDIEHLMKVTQLEKYDALFTSKVSSAHDSLDSPAYNSELRRARLEVRLQIQYASIIAQYEKKVLDFPQYVCCSCNILCKRNYVSKVKFSDSLGPVWSALKTFMLAQDPTAARKNHFMCYYCKPKIRQGKLPPRCVLNGLQTTPIPAELAKLGCLDRQFIQRAKPYQTVVRLGTYTHKVPIYNSLKACKGNMFFLPLPLTNTMNTLEEVMKPNPVLPDPNLYIIVNGKPTTRGVVWRSLVQIDAIRSAVAKLRAINWLYKDIVDPCLDEDAQGVLEVVNRANSKMLQKASPADVAEFQSYTIRDLDSKLSTESDIDQYKLLSVIENPIDNRQKHLDLMCFPVLFPDGAFGKYHPRRVKLSHSEYIKSRLWNTDSRFRKDPQYIFYLLWQKEMREIASGVFNLLKTTTSTVTSVSQLLSNVNTANESLEANLSTMFQSIRGTKQYWFTRKSELQCMVREAGPPTLFLTFSCAEYESADINSYLHIVNDVPQGYNIGKLCTEDPVSVSRQFSSKFHAFFQIVIIKGQVLGHVTHYYWKKEYQARGAPHYHVLVWIEDAPVIGEAEHDEVTAWMDSRITCHIPDQISDPDLHNLVTRYQLHKCSNYCRRKRRRGKIFLSTCKFGFPREVYAHSTIHNVEDNL